jgi:RimJ/RimL family protein N-acetyltransferase
MPGSCIFEQKIIYYQLNKFEVIERGYKLKYSKNIILKDSRMCLIRNASDIDAEAVLDSFNKVHAETDFLLSYPDEEGFSVEKEADFLADKEASSSEAELCSIIDDRIVGLAGISSVGSREKIRHRAEFGISIEKEFWRLGIGRALTEACIECAKKAGYRQLELDVVAENSNAIALYESLGFQEYGRNPRGFHSRYTGWQELVLMRLSFE